MPENRRWRPCYFCEVNFQVPPIVLISGVTKSFSARIYLTQEIKAAFNLQMNENGKISRFSRISNIYQIAPCW